MTNIVVGLCSMVLVLATAIGGLSQAFAAHSTAQSAADLAALAGAAHYQQHLDASSACAEARRIARRHEAQVTGCEVSDGGEVTVATSVAIAHRLVGVGPARAEGLARAGPSLSG